MSGPAELLANQAPDPELQQLSPKCCPARLASLVEESAHRTAADSGLLAVHVDQVRTEESREAGPVHVGYQFWLRLGLDGILAQAGLGERVRQLTCVMTVNRLIHPASELAMPDWIRSTALADILQIDFPFWPKMRSTVTWTNCILSGFESKPPWRSASEPCLVWTNVTDPIPVLIEMDDWIDEVVEGILEDAMDSVCSIRMGPPSQAIGHQPQDALRDRLSMARQRSGFVRDPTWRPGIKEMRATRSRRQVLQARGAGTSCAETQREPADRLAGCGPARPAGAPLQW